MMMLKKTCVGLLGLFLIGLIFINLVYAEVRINEVMPHTNNFLENEWVELYNSGSGVELIEWEIGDLKSNDSISLSLGANDFGIILDGVEEDCDRFNVASESCIALSTIGSRLNDGEESISLYDDSGELIDSFSWESNIKTSGDSWIFEDGLFIRGVPSPCVRGDSEESENENENSNSSELEDSINDEDIILDMDWNEDNIVNQKTMKIDIYVENLEDKDYDVKVYIKFEDNDSIISQRYDEEEETWDSGNYYVDNFFNGPGNDDQEIKLRIREKYEDFKGDAEIIFRLRENGDNSYDEEIKMEIEILESSGSSNSEELEDSNLAESRDSGDDSENSYLDDKERLLQELIEKRDSKLTGNAIVAGEEDIKTKKTLIYESKAKKIARYALYTFVFQCVLLIGLLIFAKSRTRKFEKNGNYNIG